MSQTLQIGGKGGGTNFDTFLKMSAINKTRTIRVWILAVSVGGLRVRGCFRICCPLISLLLVELAGSAHSPFY